MVTLECNVHETISTTFSNHVLNNQVICSYYADNQVQKIDLNFFFKQELSLTSTKLKERIPQLG